MSRLRAIIIVIILGLLIGGAMQAYAYEFMTEASYTRRAGYSPIPLKKAEKVVVSPVGYKAGQIVFLLMAPYEQVIKDLKSVAIEKFGKFPVIEKRVNEVPLHNYYGAEVTKMLIDKLTKFKALNINVEDFRDSRFTTKPYNVIDDKTFSILSVRIANGHDIFGADCTLIFLTRTDTWKDWYREFHTNIPVPWKGQQEYILVTDTEINLIEDIKVKMNLRDSAYFFPFDKFSPFANDAMMIKIKETIDEFNKTKKEK